MLWVSPIFSRWCKRARECVCLYVSFESPWRWCIWLILIFLPECYMSRCFVWWRERASARARGYEESNYTSLEDPGIFKESRRACALISMTSFPFHSCSSISLSLPLPRPLSFCIAILIRLVFPLGSVKSITNSGKNKMDIFCHFN